MVGYQGKSHLHCETMFELRLCKTYRLNGTNLPTYTDNVNQVNIIRTGLGITNDRPTRIINFTGRIMALSSSWHYAPWLKRHQTPQSAPT